jgi:hypothetical protein
MGKSVIIAKAAFALLVAGAPSYAPVAAETDVPSQSKIETRTWHVMIAIEQSLGPQGCDVWRYKVSTSDPIAIEGPMDVSPAHADAVVSEWLLYLHEHSPSAYRWINGPHGHDRPQVYFRKSRAEAIAAFRRDGHFEHDRNCKRSALLKHGTSKFQFVPPPGFFGEDIAEEPVTRSATVTRDIGKIPGLE